MIDLSNCDCTDWLSKGLTKAEIEAIKEDALKEAQKELKEQKRKTTVLAH